MADTSSLTWKHVSSYHYEREIDSAEQFYTTMARVFDGTGHTFFAINAAVDFTIKLKVGSTHDQVISAFQYAWKMIRHQFPTVASQVMYDNITKKCKKFYQVPKDAEDISNWLATTFFVETDFKSARDLANQDFPLGELASLYLIPGSTNSSSTDDDSRNMSLLFRSHHDIVDGIGTLKVLDHLFKFAAEYFTAASETKSIQFGSEIINLSSPLQVQAQLPAQPSLQQLEQLKANKTINEQKRAELPILCYPGAVTNTIALRSQQVGIKLTKETTSGILEACKTYGVTATHLFHAAIAIALRDLQPRSDEDHKARYMTYALIDLRNACPESDVHPASVLHTVSSKHMVLDLTIPASSKPYTKAAKEELLNILHQVRDYYKSLIIDADFLATVPEVFSSVTPPYPEIIPPVPRPNSNRTVSLSSLGLMDRLLAPRHGPIEIHDPWVVGAEYGTGLGLFLGTFDGEIRLWAGYNEAFHLENEVRGFLEGVRDVAGEIVDVMVG